MSAISIRRPHRSTPEIVRTKAEEIARRVESKHAVQWSWQGNALHLRADSGIGRGGRGVVEVDTHEITLRIELPWALRPMRSLIESRVSERLEAVIDRMSAR